MLIAEFDPSGLEFLRLAREGDFSAAHASLAALVAKHSIDVASHVKWAAVLHEKEGDLPAAINKISEIVSKESPAGKFARHHRARLQINYGMLDEARLDLEKILEDATPQIANALHDGCRIQLAYVLALQGDPKFELIANGVPADAEFFIKDAIVGKADIEALYRANQKKMARSPVSGHDPKRRA